MITPALSLITINYKTSEYIASLYKSLSDFPLPFEFIVVDNSGDYKSSDNSIVVLAPKENTGFSKGNNIGAKIAKSDLLFFINPDTLIPHASLKKLAELIKSKLQTIVSFKVLNEDGSLQEIGHSLDYSLYPQVVENKYVYCSGAALLVSKSIFNRLGGFDENYFMFVEDIDLYLTAYSQNIEWMKSEIEIVHLGGKSAEGGTLANMKSVNSFRVVNRNIGAAYLSSKFAWTLGGTWVKLNVLFGAIIDWIILSNDVPIKKIIKIVFKNNVVQFKYVPYSQMTFFPSRLKSIINLWNR